MTTDNAFGKVKDLPFADKKFENTPKVTEVLKFLLAKDPSKKVTFVPVHDSYSLPQNLIKAMNAEFNYVIEEGQTYPYVETLGLDKFRAQWFEHFVGVLLDGDFDTLPDESLEYWTEKFLGTFYVKPNYAGRCSHVCNGGFIVPHTKRGLGLGKELGQVYLKVAPQLGYVYSVFNLVFETNVASVKIWDGLGFERIGYVKNVAVLKSHDRLVGAIMFGKDLV